MRPRRTIERAARFGLTAGLGLAGLAGPACASWLDNDFYCRVYGCVVVHDGYSFDVYDAYDFNTGLTVAPGQPLVAWSGNPFEGSGTVSPVYTGTRTEAFWAAPVREEGVMLGIDTSGNGQAKLDITDDGDGVLDAGDVLSAFDLREKTDVVAEESSAQRSFYLSSRTDFYIAAQVRLNGGEGGLATPASLDRIAFSYDLSRNGTDSGMSYGRDADNSGWRKLTGADTLGDLYGSPVFIAEFTKDIRRRNSSTVANQSVRFNYAYGFEDYDLSMGAGTLSYRIEFTFYNR